MKQIEMFIATLGMPDTRFLKVTDEVIQISSRRNHYFSSDGQLQQHMVDSSGDPIKILSQPLSETVSDVGFYTFLKKILVWDPEQRISCEEAMMDPWIVQGFPL